MKSIIVGLGNQGKKRLKSLSKNEFVASVDPCNQKADFKNIRQIDIKNYDTVYICVPEVEKINLIKYCLQHKKNFLVEKPFPVMEFNKFKSLQKKIVKSKQVCYVAYNHRFEPFIKKIKFFLNKKILGKVYFCKIYYGNGTSKLIKKSSWRDFGAGVVEDLFPHILDLCDYFYDLKNKKISSSFINDNSLFKASYFENRSPDNAILITRLKNILFNLEASYCMWKNSFFCEVIGEKGSLHLKSLRKWGDVQLDYRKRIFPSGIPLTKKFLLNSKDNTWKKENEHFKKLVKYKKKNNLNKEMWINYNLMNLIKKLKK